jgi:hypothetical protein
MASSLRKLRIPSVWLPVSVGYQPKVMPIYEVELVKRGLTMPPPFLANSPGPSPPVISIDVTGGRTKIEKQE